MKILVTGANGQLGMSLRRVVPQNGQWIFSDVTDGPDTVYLDITDQEAVRSLVAKEGIDTIVNCAGYTNVDAAEDNYDLAELLNAGAVENLAVVMREAGGLLLHISTDYVFGGQALNTPIREEQKGAPLGVYGLTKLHGEEAVLRSGVRHVILRTAWLYSEFGRNFLKTMLRLTAEKPALDVVFDQVGTPTYAGDLAQTIVHILKAEADTPSFASASESARIYHYTNEGVCSWYDFAQAIASYAGHRDCIIRPCHSNEFPSKVHRPAYSVLDKTKIKAAFGLTIPYWTDSLQRCMARIKDQSPA